MLVKCVCCQQTMDTEHPSAIQLDDQHWFCERYCEDAWHFSHEYADPKLQPGKRNHNEAKP